MIRFFAHGQADTDRWDDCIRKARNGNHCAYSWYLDIVSPGWTALVEDDYERVMPLPAWKKYGISYLSQPFFTQQLGIFSSDVITPGKLEEFLAAIPAGYRFTDINLNAQNTPVEDRSCFSPQVNYTLSLAEPYEKLYEKYASNLKRNLKKADQAGFMMSGKPGPAEVVKLFRDNRGRDIHLLDEKAYGRLLQVTELMIRKNMCEVWGAYNSKDQLQAGIIWCYSHQKATMIFSGLSETGKETGAMPWLIDRFIADKAGSGITLDFEGSNDPGLARFYAGFGSRQQNYLRYVRNRLPAPLTLMLKLVRTVRGGLKKWSS